MRVQVEGHRMEREDIEMHVLGLYAASAEVDRKCAQFDIDVFPLTAAEGRHGGQASDDFLAPDL